MADISALYPQPNPQGQTPSILGQNPLQTLGQVNALQAFKAKTAVGNAFQNALTPDGTLDQTKLIQGLQDPAAAYAAPEGISQMLDMRNKSIANSRAQFELASGQNSYLASRIASIAEKPDLTKNDAIGMIVDYSRNAEIPSSVLSGWIAGLPDDPKALRTYLRGLTNATIGPAGTTERVQTVGPNGETITVPKGAANYSGAVPTALPPGQADVLAQNQAEFAGDQSRAATTLGNLRQIEQALPLISNLNHYNFGPGSPELAHLRGILVTAGIMQPGDSSLPTREEAKKYLLKYAQGSQNAGRSDAALSTALGSNPNLDLTQPANLALIKNQIGMDRMDAALPVAFQKLNPNPNDKTGYKDFKSNYYQNTDSRAFSFDLLSPEEKQKLKQELGKPGDPAYEKFKRSYNLAKRAGVLAAPPAGQQ